MKIFKNGLNLKWLLLIIGIFVISGIAIASTNPIISAETSHFGGINTTQINSTGTAINTFTGRVDFNSTNGDNIILGNGINASMLAYTPSGRIALGNILQSKKIDIDIVSNKLYFSGIMTSSAQANAICFNSGTTEVTYNGGATDCASSSEKVKHSIETLTNYNTPNNFMNLRPVVYVYNNDKQNRERPGLIAEEACVQYEGICNIDYRGNGTFIKLIINQTTNKADNALYSDGTIAPVTGINYALYTAILTAKVQEQQTQIDIQSAQIRNICTNNPQLCS